MIEQVRKISILGAGMWGRTIALLLAQNDIETVLWDIRNYISGDLDDFYNDMASKGHSISRKPIFESDLGKSCENSDILFLVLPTGAVREVASKAKDLIPSNSPVIIATKGIEETRGKFSLMTDIIKE